MRAFRAALLALAEKVGWTFVEVWCAVMLTASELGADAASAAIVAGLSAGATVLANGTPEPPAGLPLAVDVTYRVVRTYVASAAGLIAAIPLTDLDITSAKAAAIAAIPSVIALIKGFAASRAGNTRTAATLPTRVDQPFTLRAAA